MDDLPVYSDNAIKLGSYNADGVLFQVRSAAISEFAAKALEQKLSDQAILAAHRDWETQSLEHALGEKLDVTSAEQELSIGRALLWKYKAKKRGFEQMYLTTVSGGSVIILNAAVERKTAEDTVQKLLLDTMSTLKVAR